MTPPVRFESLFERRTLGVRPGLEAVRPVFETLGRPAATVPSIHVVGTNGKGSVAAMCDHALRRHGMRVGLYTSPHLSRVNERIRVDGADLSDDALREAIERVLAAERPGDPRPLSFFEILTLAGLLAFERAQLDALVVETGLGGRLDATRLVTAAVVAVTAIDLDHQRFLGETLAEIAAEKAGVFRPGVPVVVGPQHDEVLRVLESHARDVGCPIHHVPARARGPATLLGAHQGSNAAIALAACAVLRPDVTAADLEGVQWPGRLEQRSFRAGTWWLDVGHNPAAIDRVVEALRDRCDPARTVVVLGCTSDRPIDAMGSALEVLGPVWWVDLDGGPPYGRAAQRFPGPDAPILRQTLQRWATAGGTAVIVGSHRLVGPLRQWAVTGSACTDLSDPR
jgi:dihydrofolate synthase / folylpolyglutamate synthase